MFGSAVSGRFTADSDIDFVVEFEPMDPFQVKRAYFALVDALESLLGREVDLLTPASIRNPYLQRIVDAERDVIYAA